MVEHILLALVDNQLAFEEHKVEPHKKVVGLGHNLVLEHMRQALQVVGVVDNLGCSQLALLVVHRVEPCMEQLVVACILAHTLGQQA